jgi:ABC-type transport system involved in multi-copper enzyme maturation permease subunit
VWLLFAVAFFGPFMDSRAAVEEALSSLPPVFAAVFGVELNAIFTFGGFFQFIYTYIGVIGAIMAASLALSAFSREKRSKCVDFLFVKPVSRSRVFVSKLLPCLMFIIVTNILFVICTAIVYTANGQAASGMGRLILASLSLFFMQLVFASIAILYAVLARKVRSVSGIATAIGFAGFILMALNSIIKEEIIRFISPLTYFNPGTVFLTGGYEARYAITAAVVIVVCVALSYVKYVKSDTQAI